MENIYHPYEILETEEGEIVVLVEPDKHLLSLVESQSENVELDVDVDYDEEDEELYILMTVYIGDSEIFFTLPYGESWDSIIDKSSFSIAFISEKDFENKNYDQVPSMTIQLDDLTLGFIEGCKRTAEVLLGEEEFFEEWYLIIFVRLTFMKLMLKG